jgi:hypothetical protein
MEKLESMENLHAFTIKSPSLLPRSRLFGISGCYSSRKVVRRQLLLPIEYNARYQKCERETVGRRTYISLLLLVFSELRCTTLKRNTLLVDREAKLM